MYENNRKDKNPELIEKEKAWKRVKILLSEDEDQYGNSDFFLPYPTETLTAKTERIQTFIKSFINPLPMMLRAKGDTIYKKKVQRSNLSEIQQKFSESVDNSGQSLDNMMHNEVSLTLSGYGTVFAVLDKPDYTPNNLEEQIKYSVPYMTILDPFQMVDWYWAKDGSLEWIKYCIDNPVDRTDPMNPVYQFDKSNKVLLVVWSKDKYEIYGKSTKTPLLSIPNMLGFVPVIIQSQYPLPNKTLGRATTFETCRYIIMANNLNTAANMEVFKNASAILLLQIQDYIDDRQDHEKNPDTNLKVLKKQADDLKNILVYDEKAPAYLSRDLNLIDKAKAVAQTYFELALENEKSVLSVQDSAVPQSGLSKAFSFLDVNNMIASHAAALESFEIQAFELVALMSGEVNKATIKYERSFDVRSFNQRIEFIKGLMDIKYPSATGMEEAYKTLTNDISPVESIQNEINKEIEIQEETQVIPEEDNINPEQAESNTDVEEEA